MLFLKIKRHPQKKMGINYTPIKIRKPNPTLKAIPAAIPPITNVSNDVASGCSPVTRPRIAPTNAKAIPVAINEIKNCRSATHDDPSATINGDNGIVPIAIKDTNVTAEDFIGCLFFCLCPLRAISDLSDK